MNSSLQVPQNALPWSFLPATSVAVPSCRQRLREQSKQHSSSQLEQTILQKIGSSRCYLQTNRPRWQQNLLPPTSTQTKRILHDQSQEKWSKNNLEKKRTMVQESQSVLNVVRTPLTAILPVHTCTEMETASCFIKKATQTPNPVNDTPTPPPLPRISRLSPDKKMY